MGTSIVTAAAILAVAIVLSNLYQISAPVPGGDPADRRFATSHIYRINSVTGEVDICFTLEAALFKVTCVPAPK